MFQPIPNAMRKNAENLFNGYQKTEWEAEKNPEWEWGKIAQLDTTAQNI